MGSGWSWGGTLPGYTHTGAENGGSIAREDTKTKCPTPLGPREKQRGARERVRKQVAKPHPLHLEGRKRVGCCPLSQGAPPHRLHSAGSLCTLTTFPSGGSRACRHLWWARFTILRRAWQDGTLTSASLLLFYLHKCHTSHDALLVFL